MIKVAVALAVLFAGCSSIVDSPCASGYQFRAGACLLADEPGVDATPIDTIDGGSPDAAVTPPDAGTVDAPTCASPTLLCAGTCTSVVIDAQNCGSCGHVCASGLCVDGECLGEIPGHIVAIGHDYQSRNAAMARVLGNAVALGSSHDLGVAYLVGTTSTASRVGARAAVAESLAIIGRPSHEVTVPAPGATPTGIDVLIIHAQIGDAPAADALGVDWAPTVTSLLARGGVVVVLEGAAGVSHRFASSAGLFTFTPADATGTPAFVTDATDAVVQQVLTPYLADTTSVVFAGATGVIATPSGPVVVHLTR